MDDPGRLVYETTDSGTRVSGTGLPRLRTAARSGAARSRQRMETSGRGAAIHRRRVDVGRRGQNGFDPYAEEEGPGMVSFATRLRADLWHYGPGKTQDAFGTEADVRAISNTGNDSSWSGFKLRVLTQNLWALPLISRCMEARVHAFAKTLGRGWDVIALQEVWHARERDALRKAAVAAGLRYSRHFEHGCGAPIMGPGAGGTGLLVLSRFPIVESSFWRFSANGQPYQVLHCDYLGGKGVGLARIRTPAGAVDVYISHLHADYSSQTTSPGRGTIDRYKAHRVAQAFELANMIRVTSKSPLVLLMTDLNAGPGSMPYGLQRSVAGMSDAFAETNPAQAGHTFDTRDNVFADRRNSPERLDYVFYKALPPPLCPPQAVEPSWELKKCWVHKAYIDEREAEGLSPAAVVPLRMPQLPSGSESLSPSVPAALSPSVPVSLQLSPSVSELHPIQNGGIGSPPMRGGVQQPVGSMSTSLRSSGGGVVGEGGDRRRGGYGTGRNYGQDVGGVIEGRGRLSAAERVNISDHHGVAAEFIAMDPVSDDFLDDLDGEGGALPTLSARHSGVVIGSFPQGPLLTRALTEINGGIGEATARRESHLKYSKVLVVLSVVFAVGSMAIPWLGLLGYAVRGAAALAGVISGASASSLFFLYWFSAKEEVQGLREVFISATSYERHLPMEEAFPDAGFDTLQFRTYMDQNFR